MKHSITVQLVGGLGNQLFTYYAGAALAGLIGVPLRIDSSRVAHGISAECFDLPGDWIPLESVGLKGALGRLGIRSRIVRKASTRIPALGRVLRYYESKTPGFDPRLFAQPAGTTLRGYFQSWSTVQAAYDMGATKALNLREFSPWLVQAVDEARDTRPLAVHVRRGDYKTSPSFGLLSRDYYVLAIDALRAQGMAGPIWVFSDDPQAAMDLVPGDTRIMRSPIGPQEELVLMSHAAGVVTANSSFSWWAAWLSCKPQVVTPASWFKTAEEPAGLVPPWWTRVKSTWA